MALQPGVSRSGITMTAARWIGHRSRVGGAVLVPAVLPIIAGAGLYKGVGPRCRRGSRATAHEFFWGFVSSAISGFVVIWALLGYLQAHSFKVFMIYRLAVAALVFVLIATGARSATI